MPGSPLPLAVTMGDPAGVGPEVTVKALAAPDLYAIARPLVIGDARVLREAARVSGVAAEIRDVTVPDDGAYQAGQIDVLDLANLDPAEWAWGKLSAACGQAAMDYIYRAMELTGTGRAAPHIPGAPVRPRC